MLLHTANTAGTPDPTDNSLSANVSAILRPWLAQPVEQAQADLRHVDAALFMSNGPHTDLSGTLQAGPDGTGWKLHADLHNERPGTLGPTSIARARRGGRCTL